MSLCFRDQIGNTYHKMQYDDRGTIAVIRVPLDMLEEEVLDLDREAGPPN